MARHIGIKDIEALWEHFARESSDSRDVVEVDCLRRALITLGESPTTEPAKSMIDDLDNGKGVSRDQFLATLVSLKGDSVSRATIAFDVFDEDGDGQITPEELRETLLSFGIDEARITHFFAAVNRDGSGAISFDEFCHFVPNSNERHPKSYRDILASGLPQKLSEIEAEEVLDQKPHSEKLHSKFDRHGEGTSRLQMQIGLFRLLQGAAYRSFRESFAANYETHLSAKTMPYKITSFAEFTESAIALYKALGVVEPACFEILDAVPRSLREEIVRLETRIEDWASVDKTPEMLATAAAMEAERSDVSAMRHVFGALVECALTLRRKNLTPADLANGALDRHELSRLQTLDLHETGRTQKADEGANPVDYLQAWNRVIIGSADEEIDGAMMPSAYWYEDFMPKLLAACSVGTAEDIDRNMAPDEAELSRWFETVRASGEFHPFGSLIAAHFEKCAPSQKLMIRQAWRLTRHYLNGIQKQRERLEFGRDTGFLSQYVAFLDVYLGRNDVRDANMRVSFPYFIGPATWRFLHTTAEIICSRSGKDQARLIELFKDFFRLFAAMYPCPYCRYHLNRYVVRNHEVEYYPLEYLVLGCGQGEGGFEASIDAKLNTITDGPTLRLFLWKLHNAVSSSITRTEPWFHRDDRAFYASRYWPSLSEELARARAFGTKELPVDRLSHFSDLLTPVGRMASLRGRWRGMQTAELRDLGAFLAEVETPARDLEEALAAGAFLERTYRFDPSFEDDAPHFTPEEVAYSRSGMFVEA